LRNIEKEKIEQDKNNFLYLIYSLYNETLIKGQNINNYLEKIYQYLQKYGLDSNPKKIILLILDCLNTDLTGEKEKKIKIDIKKNKSAAFDIFKNKAYKTSEISKLHTGIYKKVYLCNNCKNKYYRFRAFRVLSIYVDNDKNDSNNQKSLNDLKMNDSNNLNEYFYLNFTNNLIDKAYKKEITSENYSCEYCKNQRFLTRKNIFNLCPEILIICFDKKEERKPKLFYIDLILNLDMNTFIENKQTVIDYKYNLISFIEYDQNLEENISYIKCNNSWRRMNKKYTKNININDIKRINNPQILFYERMDNN
jgi:hypothetical protein